MTGSEAALVAAWRSALSGTSHIPMSGPEVDRFLRRQVRALLAALRSHPSQPQKAQDVGVAMVDAHYVGPKALGRTLAVLGEHLPGLAGRKEGIGGLVEALTEGYVQALRHRTLDEQEAIRRADLDARRIVEEALRESEARFRAVFTSAGIGIGLGDMEGRIVDANQAFAGMLGYTIAEFCLLNVRDLMHPDDAHAMWESYEDMRAGRIDHVQMEKRYWHRDGGVVWTKLIASLIRDPDGKPRYTLALVEDVTEHRLLEEQLRHQAMHDALTQIPNRAVFLERLSDALGRGWGRVGVCFLDLDGFKVVNDSLGHHVGDELLLAVAQRLKKVAAAPGRLVARLGGDEFVLLVEHSANATEVADLAQAVLSAMDDPFDVAGHQLLVSASVGVVERPAEGAIPAEVMKDADTTLYWAKSDGRGRLAVFDPERSAREKTRYALSGNMRSGLDRGEFVVEYQPLVDLADGEVRGVEALVRWWHPRLGLLGPAEFISLAEETGVILPLGRWVLEESCRQAQAWQQLRPDVFVSVNLAARQAWDPAVVEDVTRVLEETGLPPSLLQLELTESALMGTTGRPLAALAELSALGVTLAIDDFGTGYSNLAYLKRLPVNVLKLAGPFVDGLREPGSSDVDEPIVATLVGLAHTLGMSVTAECVETAEQADRLRAMGCDLAQGWYYAHAMAPDDMARTLTGASVP